MSKESWKQTGTQFRTRKLREGSLHVYVWLDVWDAESPDFERVLAERQILVLPVLAEAASVALFRVYFSLGDVQLEVEQDVSLVREAQREV